MVKHKTKTKKETPGKMLRKAKERHIHSLGIAPTGKIGRAVYSLVNQIEEKFRSAYTQRVNVPSWIQEQGPVQDYLQPILEILSHYKGSKIEGIAKISDALRRPSFSLRDLDSFIDSRQSFIGENMVGEEVLRYDLMGAYLIGRMEHNQGTIDARDGAKIMEETLLEQEPYEKVKVGSRRDNNWVGRARSEYHGGYNE